MKKNMTEYIIKELNYIYYILRPYQRIFLFLPSPSMFHYWHSLLPILQGKSMYRGPTKCAASANTYIPGVVIGDFIKINRHASTK